MLYLVADRGIADLLVHGPQSSERLAEATGLHDLSLYRVLRALATLGVFTELPGRRFELTEVGETLVAGHPSAAREAVLFRTGDLAWQVWAAFPRVVSTGKTAMELAFGTTLFDYLEQHPSERSLFNRVMLSIHGAEPAAVVAAYDFSRFERLVDVGGGIGTMLEAILSANPELTGVLFDHPSVVEEARRTLVESSVADRCELVDGDFFEQVPPGGDAYLLSHVIHDWDDESCLTILRNCSEVMGADGTLLLVEELLPSANTPHSAPLLDILMLVYAGGMERTRDEYADLLTRAGFRLDKVVPTASTVSVIEAARAGRGQAI
jgi:ubiquinone/menaquinone biosynthesis C-methylase UbiE